MSNVREQFDKVKQSLGFKETPPVKDPKLVLPVRVDGNVAYVSGNVAFAAGELLYKGRIGANVTIAEGKLSAAHSVLNCLTALDREVGLEKVDKVLKVTGYLSCTEDVTEQPEIMHGASEVLVEIFGDAGKHARAAVGIHTLPLGASTEVDMVVSLKA
ncbi:RidA family protein [Paenibacillus hodogayensis]|uniref:RidA family protein n=1 Tax=Paenibacillus hodogayensis TaxID=279208 RepID=A0ABV5VYR8_9BACL